jgi:hypothetical protein
MSEKDKSEQHPEEKPRETQNKTVRAYTRRQTLYDYVCQLPNCPYCRNETLQSPFKGRKWCREDARMEFKRRRRAEDAIEKNRIPGLVGKPASYEEKIKKVGVFFIHALDGDQFYRVGYAKSLEEYMKMYYPQGTETIQDFDPSLVVRAQLADALMAKLKTKFSQTQIEQAEGVTFFRLDTAQVIIAKMLVKEHLLAK